jgi:hypothetical protein
MDKFQCYIDYCEIATNILSGVRTFSPNYLDRTGLNSAEVNKITDKLFKLVKLFCI